MDFAEMLKNRRSVRNYEDKPVPDDLVLEMIRESTYAPSASNGQPWEFVIVHNRELMKRMSDESKKNILARIAANPDDHARRYQGMLELESYNVFYNAPCLVIILAQTEERNRYVDCALAASYLMMAATSRGLATCWINLGKYISDPEMRSELGIAEDREIIAPIILGYPVELPQMPKREEPVILKTIS